MNDDTFDFTEECGDRNFGDNIEKQIDYDNSDAFLLKVAQLYLKLESQLLIPATTVQKIVSGTLSVHELGQEEVKNELKSRLINGNFLSGQVDEIVNEVFANDPFLKSANTLNTDYKRKKFYKDHCAFVEPIEVLLSSDHGEKVFFHYVPTKETLK